MIGNVVLPTPVILAPMSGVTDAPFRRLVARLGAGLVVSEMTASEALAGGRPDALLRAEAPGVGAHVVQLAGCEARWMGEGARVAEAAGAAVIDINMGCPARQVTSGQSGSALMRDLDHALSLIEATVEACALRFRPILMTGLAFVCGVLPMVIATGAGGASQQALGTSVMGGMIAVVILALLMVPVFFVSVQRVLAGDREKVEAVAQEPYGPPAPARPTH